MLKYSCTIDSKKLNLRSQFHICRFRPQIETRELSISSHRNEEVKRVSREVSFLSLSELSSDQSEDGLIMPPNMNRREEIKRMESDSEEINKEWEEMEMSERLDSRRDQIHEEESYWL